MLLVLCMISVSAIAVQPENAITPRYTYISSIITGLSISSAGKAACTTSVTLYSSTHDCKIDMVLQRDDGSGWDDVKSWTITDDGPDIDIEEIWYVVPGYDYQVESTLYVYNANGRLIETTTTTSPIKSY